MKYSLRSWKSLKHFVPVITGRLKPSYRLKQSLKFGRVLPVNNRAVQNVVVGLVIAKVVCIGRSRGVA